MGNPNLKQCCRCLHHQILTGWQSLIQLSSPLEGSLQMGFLPEIQITKIQINNLQCSWQKNVQNYSMLHIHVSDGIGLDPWLQWPDGQVSQQPGPARPEPDIAKPGPARAREKPGPTHPYNAPP